jgi:hypothetical protein
VGAKAEQSDQGPIFRTFFSWENWEKWKNFGPKIGVFLKYQCYDQLFLNLALFFSSKIGKNCRKL